MLAAVEAGAIDAIVTWHNDRLHRSPKELEAFIDLVERTGARLAVVAAATMTSPGSTEEHQMPWQHYEQSRPSSGLY